LNRLRKQIYSHEDKLVEKVAEKPQYKSVPESVVRRIVQEELKGHLFQRDLPQKKSKGGIPL
jgi:preprotein translocase subunit SecA